MGYIDEADGWRTNVYNLPIIGGAALWRAFWAGEILPRELVEIFSAPHVRTSAEGAHRYYGHGVWILGELGTPQEVDLTGCDAGVSFQSGVKRDTGILVTVISNTTNGAWPVLREIRGALKKWTPAERLPEEASRYRVTAS